MTELQLAAMRQARETLLIAAANFGGLAPAMRDRCIRDANALHEVYSGQAAAQPAVQQPAEDAELLDWLEEKHYALHPIKEDQGDDTYTLWWQVTDKDKSISGHPLGNIRAAIRAARAAERKA